jgi:hypothetical protein
VCGRGFREAGKFRDITGSNQQIGPAYPARHPFQGYSIALLPYLFRTWGYPTRATNVRKASERITPIAYGTRQVDTPSHLHVESRVLRSSVVAMDDGVVIGKIG